MKNKKSIKPMIFHFVGLIEKYSCSNVI